MGFFMWNSLTLLVLLAAVCIYFARDPNLNPIPVPFSPMLTFSGKEKLHPVLSKIQKISLANYTGAESLVYFNGSLYTGVNQGLILRINENEVTVLSKFGPSDCKGLYECGRPLGIRLSSDSENLIVVDAYLGIFKVSLTDGSFRKIYPPHDDRPTFLDDFTFLPNGSIILSEASTRFEYGRLKELFIERAADGRLLLLNPETGHATVLADNLRFPNGVQLMQDSKSILVAEVFTCRILRLPLDGGPVAVFTDGLPGTPDNIRPSSRGGYWVALSGIRSTLGGYLFVDILNRWPMMRSLIFKLYSTLIDPEIKSDSSMLIHLDHEGQITDVLTDPENKIPNITEVDEIDGILYFGSMFLPYVGKLVWAA